MHTHLDLAALPALQRPPHFDALPGPRHGADVTTAGGGGGVGADLPRRSHDVDHARAAQRLRATDGIQQNAHDSSGRGGVAPPTHLKIIQVRGDFAAAPVYSLIQENTTEREWV